MDLTGSVFFGLQEESRARSSRKTMLFSNLKGPFISLW
jgi:hypothetical protein